jgi:regulator of protease activity HflC (stomatin/prohibitin superfamily)
MGTEGFQPEIFPPSKVWVDNNIWNFTPEKLFLVETTTKKYNERVKVVLGAEKLTVTVDVIFRGRVTGNDKVLHTIFNDIKMNDRIVTTDEVYNVYGKQLVNNTARDIISTYNVDELPKNYGRITDQLYLALEPKLKNLPIEISDITIGDVQYPEVVNNAIQLATKKRMEIAETQAKVQIRLEELSGKEEAAKAEYKIKMLEAKRIRDYNAMTAKGITPDLLKLRELELREKELDKWNGVLPTTLMGGQTPVIVNTK